MATDDENQLPLEIEHLMLSLHATDPHRFTELCEQLGVDPKDFGDFLDFLADDAKSQDN